MAAFPWVLHQQHTLCCPQLLLPSALRWDTAIQACTKAHRYEWPCTGVPRGTCRWWWIWDGRNNRNLSHSLGCQGLTVNKRKIPQNASESAHIPGAAEIRHSISAQFELTLLKSWHTWIQAGRQVCGQDGFIFTWLIFRGEMNFRSFVTNSLGAFIVLLFMYINLISK